MICEQGADGRGYHATCFGFGKLLMPAHLLPRDPAGREVERGGGRTLLIVGELRQLRLEDGDDGGAFEVASAIEMACQRRSERFEQHRRAPDGRERLEQAPALSAEAIDTFGERQRG